MPGLPQIDGPEQATETAERVIADATVRAAKSIPSSFPFRDP